MAATRFATRQTTDELTNRLTSVERHVVGPNQDVGGFTVGLAVVRAEQATVKWMVSGVTFAMALLLVQSSRPT